MSWCPHCYSPFLLSSFFQVAYVVLSLCVGLMCELKFGQEEVCTSVLGAVKGNSAILFGKLFLWVLVVVFTACAQRHHRRSRSRGYLRFYRQMQRLKYLPINVHSAGNCWTVHVDRCFPHKMALMLKEKCLPFCVSRKRAFAACNSCSTVTHCANLHAPQHPWIGTSGSSAMSILLHRYGDLSHHLSITSQILSQLVHVAVFLFFFATVYLYAASRDLCVAITCTLIPHTLKKCNTKNKWQKSPAGSSQWNLFVREFSSSTYATRLSL